MNLIYRFCVEVQYVYFYLAPIREKTTLLLTSAALVNKLLCSIKTRKGCEISRPFLFLSYIFYVPLFSLRQLLTAGSPSFLLEMY